MIVVVSIKGMEALPADQRRSNEACKSFSDAIFFIKQILIFLGKFVVYENNTLTSERPALERIVIDKNLTIAAANFTYAEELTLLDLSTVSKPEEAVSNQALHNLIALSTKDF